MTPLTPLAPDSHAAFARRNPVAKLGMAVIVTLGLLVSGDLVTPAVLLAIELAVLPFTGVRVATLVRRTWPLVLAVAGVAVANLLIVQAGDPRVLLRVGPLDVTVGGAEAAVQISLRLLAIALPGIVALATTDPLDLADSLVQQLRVSPRFAYGALAGLRLLPLLSIEWHQLTRARRARGLDAGRTPVSRLRFFASLMFALLVAAIRRAVRLAGAMDARGFDARTPRSVARPQRFEAADAAALVLAGLAVAAATAISVVAGTWAPTFAG